MGPRALQDLAPAHLSGLLPQQPLASLLGLVTMASAGYFLENDGALSAPKPLPLCLCLDSSCLSSGRRAPWGHSQLSSKAPHPQPHLHCLVSITLYPICSVITRASGAWVLPGHTCEAGSRFRGQNLFPHHSGTLSLQEGEVMCPRTSSVTRHDLSSQKGQGINMYVGLSGSANAGSSLDPRSDLRVVWAPPKVPCFTQSPPLCLCSSLCLE